MPKTKIDKVVKEVHKLYKELNLPKKDDLYNNEKINNVNKINEFTYEKDWFLYYTHYNYGNSSLLSK